MVRFVVSAWFVYKLTACRLLGLPEFSGAKKRWDLICAVVQLDIGAQIDLRCIGLMNCFNRFELCVSFDVIRDNYMHLSLQRLKYIPFSKKKGLMNCIRGLHTVWPNFSLQKKKAPCQPNYPASVMILKELYEGLRDFPFLGYCSCPNSWSCPTYIVYQGQDFRLLS